MKMMASIITNIDDEEDTLAVALRKRRKEGLLSDTDHELLKAVYEVLQVAEPTFDVLEFSSIPTISYVVPSYYLLRTKWSENTADRPEVRKLKKELVEALDAKLWSSIVQLHFAATYLDPTLKEFMFCPVKKDRVLFRQQAVACIKEFVTPACQTHEATQPEVASSDDSQHRRRYRTDLQHSSNTCIQNSTEFVNQLSIYQRRRCSSEVDEAGYFCTVSCWTSQNGGKKQHGTAAACHRRRTVTSS